MIIVKNSFDGGLDNDSALQTVDAGDVLNLMNGRNGISEFGKTNRIENTPGTVAIVNNTTPPYGTQFTIGSCVDEQRNYMIFALFCSHGDHGIYAWDSLNNITYAIVYDSQIIQGLGFSKTARIDRNMYVVGDLLFWTNNVGEPRCINYIAGIKANQSSYATTVTPYFFPLKYQSSTLIVRPPIYPLTVTKQTDAGFLNNFTQYNAYQFTYQYEFVNYQDSALAAYSGLVPFNVVGETFNNVLVKVPFAEFIDNEVQLINLMVKRGNNGKTFIVKQWNRSNTQDANEIFSHNLGLVQLQYDFYDNVVGIFVDGVTANTPFHNVPIKTKTQSVARNRTFCANNLMGYNTPTASSLSATSSTSGSNTPIFKSGGTYKITIAFYDRFRRKCGVVNVSVPITIADRTYIQTSFTYLINWTLSNTTAFSEIPDWAYYYQIHITKNLNKSFFIQGMTEFIFYATKNSDTQLYEVNDTTFDNTKTAALAVDLSALPPMGIGYVYNPGDFAILYTQSGTNYTSKVIGQQGNLVLLSAVNIGPIVNNFQFTLVAFTTTNTGDTIYWPATATYPSNNSKSITQSTTSSALNPDPPHLGESNWSINILDGLARTYTITGKIVLEVIDNSVTYPNVTGSVYCTKIPGVITDVTITTLFTQPATAGTNTLTFSATVNVPIGYNRVTLIIFSPDVITLNVISGYINFAQSDSLKLIEIYTPNKENINEQYYEVGSVMNVTNPTLSNRTYSTLSGAITGDSSRISRTIDVSTIYYPEAMSPNDLVWQSWERDLGWFNTFDKVGQQQKKTSIAFSDTYINGTRTNGLSTFQPLNQKDIGSDGGQIQKIILNNKKQEDGTVILAISDNETVSIYLGETQVVAAATNAFVASSGDVIGTINELRGNSGTVNPESVVQYLGLVFWADTNNGWITQYSPNGIENISRFKMNRFFQRYLKNYNAASAGNLDNINGFHHITMMIDPFHKRLNVVLPGLIYANYATILPSYSSVPSYATSIINRNDAYDGLPKTLSFSFFENRWKESWEYMPEWSEYLLDQMIGFKNGAAYIHDADTVNYNKFYGTSYPVRLALTPKTHPSLIEDMVGVQIEGNTAPDFSYAYSPYPNIQITDLVATDYTVLEGVQDASFFLDRLSPSVTGTPDEKLYTGDVVKSATPILFFEWQAYSSLFYLNFVNVAFDISRGQKQLLTK